VVCLYGKCKSKSKKKQKKLEMQLLKNYLQMQKKLWEQMQDKFQAQNVQLILNIMENIGELTSQL
jgi:hypothetical protein